uniref:Low-affinity iron/zinc ion transport protein fet4 n=1 Tax=Talaromyces marneffei PM1 TaxID=1077442 RepID=A0A093UTT0_TALMA
MFGRILKAARRPGAIGAVHGVAPIQAFPEKADRNDEEKASDTPFFQNQEKSRLLDRWLDKVVRASGSEIVFYGILAALLVWALLGIPFGRTENWQVIISDVQAIFSYAYDSLLVRQQINMYDREMMVAAQMQSRIRSHLRMLSKAQDELIREQKTALSNPCNQELLVKLENYDDDKQVLLPPEGRFSRFITTVSHILGHIVLAGVFWIAIFVWLGIGPLFSFSDSWQLYMNSATSAWMVLYFTFLANIRERHNTHERKCLTSLFAIDCSLEAHLRVLTQDRESNPEVVLTAPKVNKLQRAIFYYADFVGTLVGIGIFVTVMITWLAVGPVFHFSSNWWLFIGTYAGLIGMHDGFVLRNMQARFSSYVENEMDVLHQLDKDVFQRIGLTLPPLKQADRQFTLSERVSIVVDKCNAMDTDRPTLVQRSSSIIESFLMMILVTGHNLNDDRKRSELQTLYGRRILLLRYARYMAHRRADKMMDTPDMELKELPVIKTTLETASDDQIQY